MTRGDQRSVKALRDSLKCSDFSPYLLSDSVDSLSQCMKCLQAYQSTTVERKIDFHAASSVFYLRKQLSEFLT